MWIAQKKSADFYRQLLGAIYQQWQAKGLTIAQHPVEMDFGYTFVAEDLDGHRLRVYKFYG